jgi:hypothetical protein
MVLGFFAGGGERAYVARRIGALEEIDEVALLCPLPDESEEAMVQCERRGDRVAILSLPAGLSSAEEAIGALPSVATPFAAAHYPWVRAQGELTPPGGHVAGAYVAGELAGVAPTSLDLPGLDDPPLERSLSKFELEALRGTAVNPLRDLTGAGHGVRVWGGRTLEPGPESRPLALQRLLIFLRTSIARGLGWAAWESNDQALWTSVRRVVESFLEAQWRSGALQGQTPARAYFVRCDRTTMTQNDIDNGRLICEIGVAPVRPAEFVIFRIGQWTADHKP